MAFDGKNSAFKSKEDDRVISLYQVDPAFYRKIVSRSSSSDSSGGSSFHLCPGSVPFGWETQPGEPINLPSPRTEGVPPRVGFPPDLQEGWNDPRSEAEPYFVKKRIQIEIVENVQLRPPQIVHSSCVPRPNISLVRAKANCSRNIKKSAEIIKNKIRFGQRVEKIKNGVHIFIKKVKANTAGTGRKNFEANYNFTPGAGVPPTSFIRCYRMTAKVTVVEGRLRVSK